MISKRSLLLAILAVFVFAQPAFCCPTATIGDFVWNDENINGTQDDGDSGLSGVIVNLYRLNCTAVFDSTTTVLGGFSFSAPAGYYYLEFILPSGYSFSLNDQGTDDAIDSDANTSTGRTKDFYASAGNNLTWDAGMHAVPIPGALWLLGSGLIGLAGLKKKLRK